MRIFIYFSMIMAMPYWGWAKSNQRWDPAYYYSSNFLTTSNNPQKTQENIQQTLSFLQNNQITISEFKSQNGTPFLFLLAENLKNKPIYFLEIVYSLILNQDTGAKNYSSAIGTNFKLLTNEVLNLTHNGQTLGDLIFNLQNQNQTGQLKRLLNYLIKNSIKDQSILKLKTRIQKPLCRLMFT